MTSLLRALAFGLAAASCAPLTFSQSPSIDFERFRSVRVQGEMAEYLAGQLAESSGFERVTLDPTEPIDLVLLIAVDAVADVEGDYTAKASYIALTPAGAFVDGGVEEDTSDYSVEASQDALDEVALHFIRPYRL